MLDESPIVAKSLAVAGMVALGIQWRRQKRKQRSSRFSRKIA